MDGHAAAGTIKKFLSKRVPPHADGGVNVRGVAARSATWAQVADHATSAAPAWLWSADGIAAYCGRTPSAPRFLVRSRARCQHAPVRCQPSGGAGNCSSCRNPADVAAKRGSNACAVSVEASAAPSPALARALRRTADAAIFVVAAEPVGPALALRERVSGLFAGTGKPFLAFTPDGKLLYATAPAQARFAAITSAASLGGALFDHALSAGSASGATPHGRVTIERLGTDASAVLIAECEAERSGTFAGEGGAANENARAALPPPLQGTRSRRALRRFAAATSPRRTGGIRCASSGRWTPRAVSSSARTNSSNSWGRAPRPLSAGCGARSRPT